MEEKTILDNTTQTENHASAPGAELSPEKLCSHVLEVRNVTKKYGFNLAVDDISFYVDKGEIVGFLGPNGAGKSTTMNIITGYLASTSGSVTINSYDITKHPKAAKKSIGYLPEIPPLYQEMKVEAFLNFVFDLKKLHKSSYAKKEHIAEIMELVKIDEVKDRIIQNLSKGYKQRVGLASALLGKPEVLILDEPTVGLDPLQILEMRNVIKDLGREHTVILSSHILHEVSNTCDRVIIIHKGKIIADDIIPDNNDTSLEDTFLKVITEAQLAEGLEYTEEQNEEHAPDLEDPQYSEQNGQDEEIKQDQAYPDNERSDDNERNI